MVFSLRLDVPGSIYTAPGLFPSIVGATLFAMAATLGWRAIRAGAKIKAPGWLRLPGWVRTLRWLNVPRWVRTLRWLDVPRWVRTIQWLNVRRWVSTLGWLRTLRWVRAFRRLRAFLRPLAFRGAAATGEATRTAQLMAMVTAYVLLVGLVNFEFSLPLGFFTALISSYEVISVIMVAWILRLFWQAHPARCLIVALVSVEVLATIFRYGFGIPMPAGY